MRFAYIDSQGHEVAIPSVDALALRIELGAIGPDTELYDAQADRWGPAESHEIYLALSRDASGEAYLIPSPPAPPPSGDEPALPPLDETPPPRPPVAPESLGLTLAPGPGPSLDAATGGDAPPAKAANGGFEGFELDLTDPAPSLADAGAGAEAGAGPTDVDGHPADEVPARFAGGFGEGGFDLEVPMEFGSGDVASGDVEAIVPMELDAPLNAFDPLGPPAWMEQDGPGGTDAAAGPSAPTAGSLAGSDVEPTLAGIDPPVGERPPGPREAPRRPPPKRARRSSGAGRLLVGAALLGAVAGGGYYGWQRFGDLLRPEPPRPPVVLPAIPPELEPPMRDLATAAIRSMLEEIEARMLEEDFPVEPSEDWLAGVYLANASRFGQVEVFWSGIGRFAEQLEALELETFHARYEALADSADFDAGARVLMVERADSGFLATRDARVVSYRMLGRIAIAALVLHDFLVENEDAIAYTPAAAFAGNPVEEAVPSTDALGERMWDLIENITSAMDALGTLDRVTRERLTGVLLRRVAQIGIE